MRRIGPKMRMATNYVARHEGCAILPAAEHVGPHGSRAYGYRIVHRAIAAGLIRDTGSFRTRYALVTVRDGGAPQS